MVTYPVTSVASFSIVALLGPPSPSPRPFSARLGLPPPASFRKTLLGFTATTRYNNHLGVLRHYCLLFHLNPKFRRDILKKNDHLVVQNIRSLFTSPHPMEGVPWLTLLPVVITGFMGLALFQFFNVFWLRPEKLREKLRLQGIRGPKPTLIYGNILEMKRIQQEAKKDPMEGSDRFVINYVSTLFPYIIHWRKAYGPIFMFSTGTMQILHVSRPDIVKEISHCTSLELGKPSSMQKARRALFGEGILMANGDLWTHQRKLIAPEFFMDKVKGMVKLIVEAAVPLLNLWDDIVESAGGSREIVVDDYLRNFSADVISRACFGSSYNKGEEIFLKLRQLQKAMSSSLIGIPGIRYLPTKNNRKIWTLVQEIRLLILDVAKERKEGSPASPNKDLLQSIIEGATADSASSDMIDNFVVDNCKNIYFAGHETTAVTATWCLMLLSSHPEWQARSRSEALEICQGRPPDANILRGLKTLTMVIQETLRLYPPASLITREALQDIKLGNIYTPKGTIVQIPSAMLHYDPEVWGPDANEFNPDRFARGIAGACKAPHMYIPFGLGIRTCAGQNMAMVELKIILSLLLTKFSFSISPSYLHSPAFRLTIEPEHGLPLIVSRL
ncbi:cytochrome P450 714C2-like isoform X2 [Typha latifolia]|uniref:cytochrome P450 714C2-like isoform X2 n=1 Tax=Typha latifolia TaxID=4733 RepID=UPI003C2D9DE6